MGHSSKTNGHASEKRGLDLKPIYNAQCWSRIGSKDPGHAGVILKGGCVLAELKKVCFVVQCPILVHPAKLLSGV